MAASASNALLAQEVGRQARLARLLCAFLQHLFDAGQEGVVPAVFADVQARLFVGPELVLLQCLVCAWGVRVPAGARAAASQS